MPNRDSIASGIIWSVLERLGTNCITLLTGIILARLLSPEDFGIAAMPAIFIGVSHCLLDSGFGEALIRKASLHNVDLNTAFYFNVTVGFVCFGILFLISPFVADFYHVPELLWILRIASLSTIISSLSLVQGAILSRNLNFDTLGKISMMSSVFGGVLSIIMAFMGMGVLSLVVSGLMAKTISFFLLWYKCKFRPSLKCSTYSFRYLWNFGSKMMVSGLLNIFSTNAYPVVIGKFYSPAILGNYMKGYGIALFPSSHITAVLQRVAYPVLCKIQVELDEEILRSHFRRMIKLASFVTFPIMIATIVSARSIVKLLLGDQWDDVVPILQIVAIGMMLYPIHVINLDLLRVKGRTDYFLFLEILKIIVGIVALLYVMNRGILWMAGSTTILSIVSLFINSYYTKRLIHFGIFKQLYDILPIILGSSIMGAITYLCCGFITNDYLTLVSTLVLGILIYGIFSSLFLKDEMGDFKTIINYCMSKLI